MWARRFYWIKNVLLRLWRVYLVSASNCCPCRTVWRRRWVGTSPSARSCAVSSSDRAGMRPSGPCLPLWRCNVYHGRECLRASPLEALLSRRASCLFARVAVRTRRWQRRSAKGNRQTLGHCRVEKGTLTIGTRWSGGRCTNSRIGATWDNPKVRHFNW